MNEKELEKLLKESKNAVTIEWRGKDRVWRRILGEKSFIGWLSLSPLSLKIAFSAAVILAAGYWILIFYGVEKSPSAQLAGVYEDYAAILLMEELDEEGGEMPYEVHAMTGEAYINEETNFSGDALEEVFNIYENIL